MTENLLVGLVALALVPFIARRIRRSLREGQVPLYRSYLRREEGRGKFAALLALHALSLLLVAVIAADLLLGLGLKEML